MNRYKYFIVILDMFGLHFGSVIYRTNSTGGPNILPHRTSHVLLIFLDNKITEILSVAGAVIQTLLSLII